MLQQNITDLIKLPQWQKFFAYVEPIPFEERINYIGGSSIAAIIGANPYTTSLEVWNVLVNKIEPTRTEYAEKKLRAGKKLEKIIWEYFIEEFEPDDHIYFTDHNTSFKSLIYDYICGTPDGLAVKNGKSYVVELKNMGARTAEEFKSGNIPTPYLCQANLYSELFQTDYYIFGVLIDGYDFQLFGPFERDSEFIRTLIAASQRFIQEHVLPKIPPEPQTFEEVKILYPHSKESIILANPAIIEKVQKAIQIQASISELEKELDAIKTTIGQYMGENELLVYQQQPMVRFKTVKTERFHNKEFQKDYPELYKKYAKPSSYRTMVFIHSKEDRR